MDPGAAEGDVYVMQRDGSAPRPLAHTAFVTSNDGAMPQWTHDGKKVCFRDRDGSTQLISLVDVQSGKKESWEGDLRMLSPTSYHNVYHTPLGSHPDHEVVARRGEFGVFLQDLRTRKVSQLTSVEECLSLHPRRDEIATWHLYIKHTKWSPDGKRILFVFTNEIRYAERYGELPRVKDVYVINSDGSGLKRVGEFGDHPSWHPNGHEVLTNSPYPHRPIKSLVLTNVDTGEQRLAATCMAGFMHPSFSPDGSMIALDYARQREGWGCLNLIHVESDTSEHLAQMKVIDHSHVGTHIHPVWSRDGRQLLYANDGPGHAELFVIDVREPDEAG
jgi:Tol biopolymer transport system component